MAEKDNEKEIKEESCLDCIYSGGVTSDCENGQGWCRYNDGITWIDRVCYSFMDIYDAMEIIEMNRR